MENSKSCSTPGVKSTSPSTVLEDSSLGGGPQSVPPGTEAKKLDREGMKLYRSAVARCNYLAADRYETAFATRCFADRCPVHLKTI